MRNRQDYEYLASKICEALYDSRNKIVTAHTEMPDLRRSELSRFWINGELDLVALAEWLDHNFELRER